MADKPILFSGPMVRALLVGTKTQTRRLYVPKHEWDKEVRRTEVNDLVWPIGGIGQQCGAPSPLPRYSVGDRLYVREHWRTWAQYDDVAPRNFTPGTHVAYEATKSPNLGNNAGRFRQGMRMPRWASRLTLIVTDVRVERLQDCSEEDARAEGIIDTGNPLGRWQNYLPDAYPPGIGFNSAVNSYATLWNSINGNGAWESNPWVAAYTFTVEHGNIDSVGRG